MKNEALRELPGVDVLLNDPAVKQLVNQYGLELVTYAVRAAIDTARGRLLRGESKGDLVVEAEKTIKKIADRKREK